MYIYKFDLQNEIHIYIYIFSLFLVKKGPKPPPLYNIHSLSLKTPAVA